MTLRRVIVDTNILIHLVRDNRIGRSIDSRFSLRTREKRPLISIITVGEALAFAKKLSWGPVKLTTLENLFEDLVIVEVSDEILEQYAKVDFFLSRSGKPIEQNDMWIA